MVHEEPTDRRTIENDNSASNMLILNNDLQETYPFSVARVAMALEPHMLKETAFSDTQYATEIQHSLNATAKTLKKSNYTTEPRNSEPSIQTHQPEARTLERAAQKPPKKAFTSSSASEELFLMDSYYKELMKKERAAFERVLASKLNVQERELERRF